VIPFLLTIGFFVYAAWLYVGLERPPADALTINVVAKQWMWKFQHPAGQSEIDDLHVPVGEPVKLVMISQDVIHSLYLPALRIKQDVLPGRYTTLWFKADRPGVYRVRCAEFCGTEHSLMGGRLFVLTQADYARWLRQARAAPALAARGRDLYARLGCGGCHDAGAGAPPLGGLYGRAVRLADGRAVTADATYLRDSLITPNKDLVAGYAGGMPPYAQLSEDQTGAVISYLQSLAPGEGGGTP
jgi:cytochrome c oxidase subunit 2